MHDPFAIAIFSVCMTGPFLHYYICIKEDNVYIPAAIPEELWCIKNTPLHIDPMVCNLFDEDNDGDVDLKDLSLRFNSYAQLKINQSLGIDEVGWIDNIQGFINCMNRSCNQFDYDKDGDVDLRDFAIWMNNK